MKRLFLILFIILCLAPAATAYEILVLKSGDSMPYSRVARAFEDAFNRRVPARGGKAIAPHRFREIILTQEEDIKGLPEPDELPADLILALGRQALQAARSFHVPVIYSLVADPEKITTGYDNITGVNLTIPPTLQFAKMKSVLPLVKRVGVLYDPKRSRKLIDRARQNIDNLEVIALEVSSAREVSPLLETLRGRVDLLWMIPDLTVINKKTLNSYFLFSFQNKIPILTFSERYLKSGAALSVSFDLRSLGQSAADQAALILGGIPVSKVAPREADGLKTKINQTILKKLGLSAFGGGP